MAVSMGRVGGAMMDTDQMSLCLFFARSPIRRHREWVEHQLVSSGLDPNTLISSVSPWDYCGTDDDKGLEALLILLDLCNREIERETP